MATAGGRTLTYEWVAVDVTVFIVCGCGFEVRCQVENEGGFAKLYPLPDTATYTA
jgi:hypothetical protein